MTEDTTKLETTRPVTEGDARRIIKATSTRKEKASSLKKRRIGLTGQGEMTEKKNLILTTIKEAASATEIMTSLLHIL